MSTPASATAHVNGRDHDRDHDRTRPQPARQCVGVSGMLGAYPGMDIDAILNSSPVRHCKRHVVWLIDGKGVFCNHCFEAFFAANWREVTLEMIHRLSDREEDFFQSSGNEKHNGYNGHK